MTRRTRTAAALGLTALLVLPPLSAHAHVWSVGGSYKGSLIAGDCRVIPECSAFLHSGCNEAFLSSNGEGIQASIVRLPAGVGGHQAKFKAQLAYSPPAVPGDPTVDRGRLIILNFIGDDPSSLTGCGTVGPVDATHWLYGATSVEYYLRVHPNARWMYVTDGGLDVKWSLTGILH